MNSETRISRTAFTVETRLPRLSTELTEKPGAIRVGVIVCHGMGQQVPFETLDCVAKALLDEIPQPIDNPAVGLVKCGEDLLARSEIRGADKDGNEYAVHIYEAYWAPLTEGRVGLWDVFKFLFDGGRRGLGASLRGWFDRWLFGGMRKLRIERGTWLKLILAFIAVGILLSALLFFFGLLLIDLGYVIHQYWEGISFSCAFFEIRHRTGSGVGLLIWLIAALPLWKLRNFLIQFVGDVAVYVSAYKVSKFYEIRHQIQAVGLNVAKCVYSSDYERIIILGHSLGSVLAYDTLNAMLNQDEVGGNYNVKNRTGGLLTFGSPLDKTAFLFRTQVKNARVREALAATVQPLIVSYENRTIDKPSPRGPERFRWINIFAPSDWISGSLDYYDYQPHPHLGIHNVRDPEASLFPPSAHTEYWDHRVFRQWLWKLISERA